MTHINHREAHVSAQLDHIFDFIHRGHAAQRAVDKIIEEVSGREPGRQGNHPQEGGGKRLPRRSARPHIKENHGSEPHN